MKKFVSLLLAVMCMTMLFAVPSYAEAGEEAGVYAVLCGACGGRLTTTYGRWVWVGPWGSARACSHGKDYEMQVREERMVYVHCNGGCGALVDLETEVRNLWYCFPR